MSARVDGLVDAGRPRNAAGERLGVAALGATCAAIVLLVTWAVLVSGPDVVAASGAALSLPLAALALGVVGMACARWLCPWRAACVTGCAGLALLALLAWRDAALFVPSAALPVLGAALAGALRALARRLPQDIDGVFGRRPLRAGLWALLALVLLAQTVRFSAFMADARLSWGSVVPFVPQTVRHMCLAAYVEAADLARHGRTGLYDPATYRSAPEGSGGSGVIGLAPYLEDAFLYPPPFLLLPRLALALSDDYRVLRTAQYALQAFAFVIVALVLAGWVGGRAGRLAGFLVPALLASTPLMFNLQYGQAQLAVVVLAVAALLLIERERVAWGGALLACATLAKVFPGVLLVLLLAGRRWRALAWTVAWSALFVGLTWLVFGAAPFVEYVQVGQAAKVAGGAAVRAFEDDFLTVVNNISAYSLVLKLRYGGVPGMTTPLAEGVSWAWSILPLGLAWWAGRRRLSAVGAVTIWLALLNLAAMRSPNAPAVYTLAGTLWLLAWLAHRAMSWQGVAGLTACWVLFMGLPPLPSRGLLVALSVLVHGLAVGLNVWAVAQGARGAALAGDS